MNRKTPAAKKRIGNTVAGTTVLICDMARLESTDTPEIATPEARTLRQSLRNGAAGARLTREAQESLDRLAKRAGVASGR